MANEHWMLAADERRARLLRLERTASGSVHVDDVDEIGSSWEEHQHGRSSPLSGRGGHTNASWGHEEETRRARFAKELAAWLERQTATRQIERLALFAPPRFLGALRDAWSPRLASRVDEHHGELTHLSIAELSRHDAVADLVSVGQA